MQLRGIERLLKHYSEMDGLSFVKRAATFGSKNICMIRYDCAHDYAHKDRYNNEGQCRKVRVSLDYDDALTLADDDINENWEIYKDRFVGGGFP